MKKLILISGTMGVGKTSTCQELQNILQPSVWLDGDWCWHMNPWSFSDENKKMVTDNIHHLLNSYLHNSYFEYIIFSWVMHKQEIIDLVLSKLDLQDTQVYTFSLMCNENTLKSRILNDSKRDFTHFENHHLNMYHSIDSIKIDTSDKSIKEVALEISEVIYHE